MKNKIIKKEEYTKFQSILLPISSEFYPPTVFQISAFLADTFHGNVTSVYITEKRTLDEMERLSDTHLSYSEIEEAQRDVRHEYLIQAECIVFEDARAYFKKRNIPLQTKCAEGDFSEVIKKEIRQNHYDLIVMGYEKKCYIDYTLIDESDIPIWIESGIDNDTILAVCSNLSPNKKVPLISQHLSMLFGKKLHMIYVVDLDDPVLVDPTGIRSEKKSVDELMEAAKKFQEKMKKNNISVQIISGSFEKETIKALREIKPKLVIIGREQKKKGMFGFSVRNIKRKLAEHCKYSLLFMN
jgi:hypothetical protein